MVATMADCSSCPNQASRTSRSPNSRSNCPSSPARSSSVSLTSNTHTGAMVPSWVASSGGQHISSARRGQPAGHLWEARDMDDDPGDAWTVDRANAALPTVGAALERIRELAAAARQERDGTAGLLEGNGH